VAITVDTEAADRLLATQDDLERELGGKSIDPNLAEDLILAASDAIEHYLGTILALQKYSETMGGEGGLFLYTTYSPLIPISATSEITVAFYGSDVSGVSINDADIGEVYVESGTYWTAAGGGGINRVSIAGQEQPLYTVVYRAGYWLPNWAVDVTDVTGKRDLPRAIRRACAVLAAHYYRAQEEGGGMVVIEKRVDDFDVKYESESQRATSPSGSLPDDVLALLPSPRYL